MGRHQILKIPLPFNTLSFIFVQAFCVSIPCPKLKSVVSNVRLSVIKKGKTTKTLTDPRVALMLHEYMPIRIDIESEVLYLYIYRVEEKRRPSFRSTTSSSIHSPSTTSSNTALYICKCNPSICTKFRHPFSASLASLCHLYKFDIDFYFHLKHIRPTKREQAAKKKWWKKYEE